MLRRVITLLLPIEVRLTQSPLCTAGLARDEKTGLVHISERGAFHHFATVLVQEHQQQRPWSTRLAKFPPTLRSKLLDLVPQSKSGSHLVDQLDPYLRPRTTAIASLKSPPKASSPRGTICGKELSPDQYRTLEIALDGRNLYIAGGAGTGKTVVLKEIIHRLREKGLNVAVTATTGVAALHLEGRTFQFMFGFHAQREALMQQYSVVVIDEVSMMDWKLFRKFDIRARRARGVNAPFGGLQVILCGDFMQLGVVKSRNPLYQCPNKTFLEHFVHIRLTTAHRLAAGTDKFAKVLQELREGRFPPNYSEVIRHLPYDEPLPTHLSDATHIFMRNKEVDQFNLERLERIPGEARLFSPIHSQVSLEGTWTDTIVVKMEDRIGEQESLRQSIQEACQRFLPDHNISLDGRVVCSFPIDDGKGSTYIGFRTRLSIVSEEVLQLDQLKYDKAMSCMRSVIGTHGFVVHHTMPSTEVPLPVLKKFREQVEEENMNKDLLLKIGARVMLRWNLTHKLVNGSLGEVINFVPLAREEATAGTVVNNPFIIEGVKRYMQDMANHGIEKPLFPLVQFNNGELTVIPPIARPIGGHESDNYFSSILVGIPLALGWAFTVHKVQGLTLEGPTVIDFKRHFRCPGAAYVALSRARKQTQLWVRDLTSRKVHFDKSALVFDASIPPASSVSLDKLDERTKPGTREIKAKKETKKKQSASMSKKARDILRCLSQQ